MNSTHSSYYLYEVAYIWKARLKEDIAFISKQLDEHTKGLLKFIYYLTDKLYIIKAIFPKEVIKR